MESVKIKGSFKTIRRESVIWSNACPAAENVNSAYGPDTVTVNHTQFRFHSGSFDVKDASIVENIDKIMDIVESSRHVSTVSIAQELKITQKTVWNCLKKAGYEK